MQCLAHQECAAVTSTVSFNGRQKIPGQLKWAQIVVRGTSGPSPNNWPEVGSLVPAVPGTSPKSVQYVVNTTSNTYISETPLFVTGSNEFVSCYSVAHCIFVGTGQNKSPTSTTMHYVAIGHY